MKKFILCLFIIAFIALSSTAYAVTVKGVFTGYIDYVSGPQDLQNEIEIGTKFIGNITYDYDGDSPTVIYEDGGRIYEVSNFSIKYTIIGKTVNHHLTGDAIGGIYLFNGTNNDVFAINYIAGWKEGSIAGYIPDEGQFSLADSSGTAFSDDSLPLSLNLEDFDSNRIWIFNYGAPEAMFEIGGELGFLVAVNTSPSPDLDQDGDIDGNDLSIFSQNFGSILGQ